MARAPRPAAGRTTSGAMRHRGSVARSSYGNASGLVSTRAVCLCVLSALAAAEKLDRDAYGHVPDHTPFGPAEKQAIANCRPNTGLDRGAAHGQIQNLALVDRTVLQLDQGAALIKPDAAMQAALALTVFRLRRRDDW